MTAPPSAHHDPGPAAASSRASAVGDAPPRGIDLRSGHRIRVGTAGWTDPTLLPAGVFYPIGADTPEERLRYYASRFPLVEIDSSYYGLPVRRNAELWAVRTPEGFTFDIKAYALMTGHPTEVARLPKALRELLPPALRTEKRRVARDLPREIDDEEWGF